MFGAKTEFLRVSIGAIGLWCQSPLTTYAGFGLACTVCNTMVDAPQAARQNWWAAVYTTGSGVIDPMLVPGHSGFAWEDSQHADPKDIIIIPDQESPGEASVQID